MYVLRLLQVSEEHKRYNFEITIEGYDQLQTATVSFEFQLTPQDQEDLRWYLEDYFQFPLDPAPKIAARIEIFMKAIGAELFKAVFQTNDDVRALWAKCRESLSDTRIEILLEGQGAIALPWELLSDAETGTGLALQARSFVRVKRLAENTEKYLLPSPDSTSIRILLVICRPAADDDVPFRSVASHMLRGLSEKTKAHFQLDVLRPATFERLEQVLQSKKEAGTPYHIVHFDGHGIYEQQQQRGFLLFENAAILGDPIWIHGELLGKTLKTADVPIAVLNACQSAYAEPLAAPGQPTVGSNRSQAFGSLADELIAEGILGVVAMRYKIYVVTAAQFVADFYSQLMQGYLLGEAVTAARRCLSQHALREAGLLTLPLQDWCVPVVYETIPFMLVAGPELKPESIEQRFSSAQVYNDSWLRNFPLPPLAGFIGREETLLRIDRAFDTHWVVLLHGYAGSGKSAAAMEFARWYLQTGALPRGRVLFTSFKKHTTVTDLLNQIGYEFKVEFERKQIDWQSLSDLQRYEETVQILSAIPVLWVWDGMESVVGCPTGAFSDWSRIEQQQLLGFLRHSGKTKVKFLLTSRRNEQNWLNGLPICILLGVMPMSERVQLARVIAEERGQQSVSLVHYLPLLRFSEGDPLTLKIVLNEALDRGLCSADEINDFSAQLLTGKAVLKSQLGRQHFDQLKVSLCASFDRAFNKEDQRKLAYLQFFRTIVRADILSLMGSPETQFRVPEMEGMTEDACDGLLNRAAEFGLLVSFGDSFFFPHPALPFIFKDLFGRPYRPDHSVGDETEVRDQCCFAEVMGVVGNNLHRRFEQGDRWVLRLLVAYEENLLYAYRLALSHSLWEALIKAMSGLRVLYFETGRLADWKKLVDQVSPHFAAEKTKVPSPWHEYGWHLILQSLIHLARESDNLAEAERLGRQDVDFTRKRAAPVLALPTNSLDVNGRFFIESLANALLRLGDILCRQHNAECIGFLEESLALNTHLNNKHGMILVNLQIAWACTKMDKIRDLDRAENCLRQSLELCNTSPDRIELTHIYEVLGQVFYQHFLKDKEDGKSEDVIQRDLENAIKSDQMSLSYCPEHRKDLFIELHRDLGRLYSVQGDFGRAIQSIWESTRYMKANPVEQIASDVQKEGNPYAHAQACLLQAITLMQSEQARGVTWETGRLRDARVLAETALHVFESLGETDSAENTRNIIKFIDILMEPEEDETHDTRPMV